MSAYEVVKDAVAGDSRLRLLTGVAAVGAVISLVLGWVGGDAQLAIIGGAFVVAFMILLAIFITITDSQNQRPYLTGFLIWSIALGFIASIAMVGTSFFFCVPRVLGDSCAERAYIRGEITHLPDSKSKEVAIAFDEFAMGAFRKDLKAYRFVIFNYADSDREVLTVTVRPTNSANDTNEDIKVHLSCVASFLRSRKMIEWRYAEPEVEQADGSKVATPTLFHRSRRIGAFGLIEPITCDTTTGRVQSVFDWRRLLPGMAAFAQTPPVRQDPAPLASAVPSQDVQDAIKALTDDNAGVRRAARSILASAPVEAVPAIIKAMRDNAASYRTLLGGSVALTEMLRQNKADAARIAGIINAQEDRELLLTAAGDSERTLRIYASEFLYDLGDPKISREALRKAADTKDENARYSLLLVAQGGWDKLAPEEKAAAAADLAAARAASGPMTRKLLDKLQ